MRFEVPQFIDVKDKIFGPFTFKQFLYLAGAGGLAYLAIRVIPSFIKYPIALVLALFGLALAFYKMNGRPFSVMLQAMLTYLFSSKLFLWHQRDATKMKSDAEDAKKKIRQQDQERKAAEAIAEDHHDDGELRDLAWNLDILDTK